MPSTGLYNLFHTQTNTYRYCRPLSNTATNCLQIQWKRRRPAVDVAMQERTLHAVCPKLLKFFSCWDQPISDIGAHLPETKRSRTPCKKKIWAAKHAFCMTVLCCPWKGCPWETQRGYPNHAKLDTVFSATVLHSMQRIILASKACLLHDCPWLSSEKLFLQYLDDKKKEQAKLYTVISVDSAAWGFSPAGSDVLSADVISTKVLSDLIHSWAMEHAPMLPPVVATWQQSPKHDMSCMDLERKQRIVDGFVEAKPSDNSSRQPQPVQTPPPAAACSWKAQSRSLYLLPSEQRGRNKSARPKQPYHGCELCTMQKRKTASKRMSLEMPPRDLANRFMRPKAPAQGWCICRIHLELGPWNGWPVGCS